MSQTWRECAECGDERPFEQYHSGPGNCPDSPDGYCPEWACAECGTAIFAGVLPRLAEPAVPERMPGKVA